MRVGPLRRRLPPPSIGLYMGVKRALVVEQLNPTQRHWVAKGLDVPPASLEERAGGVNSYGRVLRDAFDRSVLTGLPVLVAAYRQPMRGLTRDEANQRARMAAAFKPKPYNPWPDGDGRAA